MNHLTGEVTLSNYFIEGADVIYSKTNEDGSSLISKIETTKDTDNFFDCEVGYAENKVAKTWVANNNNKQILLYKFSLSEDTKELVISQPLTISSLVDNISFEFSLIKPNPIENKPPELLAK